MRALDNQSRENLMAMLSRGPGGPPGAAARGSRAPSESGDAPPPMPPRPGSISGGLSPMAEPPAAGDDLPPLPTMAPPPPPPPGPPAFLASLDCALMDVNYDPPQEFVGMYRVCGGMVAFGDGLLFFFSFLFFCVCVSNRRAWQDACAFCYIFICLFVLFVRLFKNSKFFFFKFYLYFF